MRFTAVNVLHSLTKVYLHYLMHGWLVRVVPSLRASMPLNPYAAPFVKGSSSAAAASDAATSSISAAPRVFCDLDGCLVDFEKGCKSVTGKTPDKLTPKAMWSALARTKGFCELEISCFVFWRWG